MVQEPPYLQLKLRVPSAKHDAALYDAGCTFLPVSALYDPTTGLIPMFHHTLCAMLMEILHAPSIQFSYMAVDIFDDELWSNNFFGTFQFATQCNRPLPDRPAVEAYFQ
jgi:hypothetical protein